MLLVLTREALTFSTKDTMSYHQFVSQETGESYGSFSVSSYENRTGFYWIACFPGCLPDGDYEPCGPFATEQEAIDDANAGA